ncbi:protein aatf [Anaeramoeba flamelloides]|uniref:Protein aatf n=1 Tax=Anaeramoeba flamelloides TaxID=1746091 RepID=A0AAV8AA21_9EUKA|nr:protein aatf [Anaeramoeba flamelloides]
MSQTKSKKKKKSVAQELSKLLDPTPNNFSSSDELGEKEGSTSSSEEEENYTIPTRQPGKSLSGPNPLLEVDDYEGKVTSRSVVLHSSESDSESESESENNLEPDIEFEERQDQEKPNKIGKRKEKESESDWVEELERSEKQVIEDLERNNIKQYEKARSVLHQEKLLSKWLEIRIHLQKLLTKINRLPVDEESMSFFKKKDPQIEKKIQQIQQEIFNSINTLFQIKVKLVGENKLIKNEISKDIYSKISKAIKKNQEKDTKIKNLDSVLNGNWKQYNKLDLEIENYILESIEKWNKKTQIIGGQILSKKFKSFNQSINYQIDRILDDKQRLRKRTSTKRSKEPIFGFWEKQSDLLNQKKENKKNAKNVNDNDIENENENEKNDESQILPSYFDDSDFYQQLLREFIDSYSEDQLDNKSKINLRNNKTRKRNYQLSKFSKDKRIKFVIHEKLVNFMNRIPINVPEMTDGLFGSLFQ